MTITGRVIIFHTKKKSNEMQNVLFIYNLKEIIPL